MCFCIVHSPNMQSFFWLNHWKSQFKIAYIFLQLIFWLHISSSFVAVFLFSIKSSNRRARVCHFPFDDKLYFFWFCIQGFPNRNRNFLNSISWRNKEIFSYIRRSHSLCQLNVLSYCCCLLLVDQIE